jgi:CRP/FNR family transcriptional regulator, cyclic AMP receptor protein
VIFRRDAKMRLLSDVPLFKACSQPELAKVADIATQLDEPQGKVLIREGEPGRDFFVLVEGTAEVRRGNRRVATLGPGDFAGEIALLTNAPRTATVKTTSPVSVLRVTTKGFTALLDASPTIERKIRKALADRVAPSTL